MRIRTSTYIQIRAIAPLVSSGASLAIVGSMFLGWFRSGSRMRNSFEMFRIPQQLGLDGFTGVRVIWFMLPVMALGVLGFSLLQRRLVAAALACLISLIGIAVGGIVLSSPLDTGLGPALAVPAGLIGLVAGILLAVTSNPPSINRNTAPRRN